MTDHEEKLAQIYNAAIKVFAHYGFRQATMEQIASRLGLVKGSLYSYCSGKEDLYNKAVAYALELWQQKVFEAANAEKDVVQKLITLAVKSNEYLSDNDDLRTIIMNDPQIQSLTPSEERFPNMGIATFRALKQILEEGINEGKFRSIDVEKVIGFIYSIHCMFIVKTYIKAEGQSAQDMYRAGIDVFLNGLLAD